MDVIYRSHHKESAGKLNLISLLFFLYFSLFFFSLIFRKMRYFYNESNLGIFFATF